MRLDTKVSARRLITLEGQARGWEWGCLWIRHRQAEGVFAAVRFEGAKRGSLN